MPEPSCADEVQLDEAVGVGPAVGLSSRGATDGKAGPGMIGRRLAIVQQVVGGQGDQPDGGRIARVTIIFGQPEQQTHRALADVAVVPIADSLGLTTIVPSGLMPQWPLKTKCGAGITAGSKCRPTG